MELLENLKVMTATLVQSGLFWGVARIGETGSLFEVEAQAVARAVSARRAEFLAGRLAARRAMEAMGREAVAVPMGADRAPVWPMGLVGSISHLARAEGGLAVAVVTAAPARIGVDLELDMALTPDLIPEICLPQEIGARSGDEAGRWARRIFAAKEAIYKAEYPAHRLVHGFHGVQVDLLDGRARYTDHPEVAAIAPDSPPYLPVVQTVRGGLILSLSLRRGDGC